MMAWTDRHCRRLHRLFAPDARLYTEMVTAAALLHGRREQLLAFDAAEHPVAIQIGGSEPAEVAAAAVLAEQAGFDEINLNVGCPSERVQSGCFGAALMAEPERVAAIAARCIASLQVPFTVKCRLGVDDLDSEAFLERFVATVAAAGVETFIVHARKAILAGLSPAENRSVPALDYQRVYRLKARHPELTIIINGGIDSVDASLAHLQHVDGVMLGRAAYHHPGLLSELNAAITGRGLVMDERAALNAYLPYVRSELAAGTALRHLSRHLLHLFAGQSGARRYRRILTEGARRPGAGMEVIEEALAVFDGGRRAA